MDGRTRWAIAGVVLGLAAAITLPTIAQESPEPEASPEPGSLARTVTATGTATVRSAPDEAVVTLGVRTDAATAEEAMASNAERMGAVIGALLDVGLSEGDLATASVSLWPRYADDGSTVVGYTAENQLTVTLADVDRVGRVIDRAVEAGANLSSGISFRVSDEGAAAERALRDAVADARRKAELLAAAGGASLGRVVTIAEAGAPTPPPITYDYAVAESAVGTTPILPPTLESQVSVTVVWELV